MRTSLSNSSWPSFEVICFTATRVVGSPSINPLASPAHTLPNWPSPSTAASRSLSLGNSHVLGRLTAACISSGSSSSWPSATDSSPSASPSCSATLLVRRTAGRRRRRLSFTALDRNDIRDVSDRPASFSRPDEAAPPPSAAAAPAAGSCGSVENLSASPPALSRARSISRLRSGSAARAIAVIFFLPTVALGSAPASSSLTTESRLSSFTASYSLRSSLRCGVQEADCSRTRKLGITAW
mmetsp:Transcript_9507/g.24507  ORF Transcript_9507/g.24507 Transcript_9507/m.24507 type:complete len:240 (-) Transcript_9507:261-980(-)